MIDRVALLRGINVGGHRVKMAALRSIFEAMGYGDVATHIASGNVLFGTQDPDDARTTALIEEGLRDALGYDVLTFVRSTDDMLGVVDALPEIDFGAATSEGGGATYVIFLKESPDGDVRRRFESLESDFDRFTFRGREIYWSLAGKMSESPLFRLGIEQAVGERRMTTRNATTVRTLSDKLLARRG